MQRLASLFKTKQTLTQIMADTDNKVKFEEGDPQSVQDLTGFVPFCNFYNLIRYLTTFTVLYFDLTHMKSYVLNNNYKLYLRVNCIYSNGALIRDTIPK